MSNNNGSVLGLSMILVFGFTGVMGLSYAQEKKWAPIRADFQAQMAKQKVDTIIGDANPTLGKLCGENERSEFFATTKDDPNTAHKYGVCLTPQKTVSLTRITP